MEPGEKLTWVRAGIVAGFVATVSYVWLVVGSGGALLGVAIASLFGLADWPGRRGAVNCVTTRAE